MRLFVLLCVTISCVLGVPAPSPTPSPDTQLQAANVTTHPPTLPVSDYTELLPPSEGLRWPKTGICRLCKPHQCRRRALRKKCKREWRGRKKCMCCRVCRRKAHKKRSLRQKENLLGGKTKAERRKLRKQRRKERRRRKKEKRRRRKLSKKKKRRLKNKTAAGRPLTREERRQRRRERRLKKKMRRKNNKLKKNRRKKNKNKKKNKKKKNRNRKNKKQKKKKNKRRKKNRGKNRNGRKGKPAKGGSIRFIEKRGVSYLRNKLQDKIPKNMTAVCRRSNITCPRDQLCMLNIQNLPVCRCIPSASCGRATRAALVCGTDDRTYLSRCHLAARACALALESLDEKYIKVTVKRPGPCDEREGEILLRAQSKVKVRGRGRSRRNRRLMRKMRKEEKLRRRRRLQITQDQKDNKVKPKGNRNRLSKLMRERVLSRRSMKKVT